MKFRRGDHLVQLRSLATHKQEAAEITAVRLKEDWLSLLDDAGSRLAAEELAELIKYPCRLLFAARNWVVKADEEAKLCHWVSLTGRQPVA